MNNAIVLLKIIMFLIVCVFIEIALETALTGSWELICRVRATYIVGNSYNIIVEESIGGKLIRTSWGYAEEEKCQQLLWFSRMPALVILNHYFP